MAGQAWSIKIAPSTTGGNAVFTPDVDGAAEGSTLQAQTTDLVSWNNQTGDSHHPWVADSSFNPVFTQQGALSPCIPKWESSVSYLITEAAGTTINYVCLDHLTEHGTISVAAAS